MEEGTLKTPTPKCCLYLSFLLGAVKQFCRFWIWSETECKTPAEYGLQHNSTPFHIHTLSICIYCTFSLGRGRGDVREKVEGQQNTRLVPSSMGATVPKLGWLLTFICIIFTEKYDCYFLLTDFRRKKCDPVKNLANNYTYLRKLLFTILNKQNGIVHLFQAKIGMVDRLFW